MTATPPNPPAERPTPLAMPASAPRLVGSKLRGLSNWSNLSDAERSEQLARMGKSFEKFMSDPANVEALKSIGAAIANALKPVAEVFAAIGKTIVFVVDAISRLPDQLRAAVLGLAKRGWFFDPEMDIKQIAEIERNISADKGVEVDRIMADHFAARLDDIEARLVAAFPHRASKFKSGFAAHRRGEFDLSIMAFFAQADGISHELRGGFFFLKDLKKQRPMTAEYVEAVVNEIDRIVHQALVEDLPIKHKMDTARGSGALNRAAVMHGDSLDYDTLDNSLRALSLLNYVALALDNEEGSALARASSTPAGQLVTMAARAKAGTLGVKADPKLISSKPDNSG